MEDYDSKKSKFNEAMLKMDRLNNSQKVINSLRTNMLFFNHDYAKYNYEVICSELISLIHEIFGKMNVNEKEKAKEWRTKLLDYLEFVPIWEIEKNGSFSDGGTRKTFYKQNWLGLRTLMLKIEEFVREQLEEHEFSGTNIESAAGYD